ncbi:MAG: efflux RND transporter periplasmic adaptor subunit [Bryobacterales bacterium]|nr:efflux RND transporter periplasmic adaptor subunit [Bryobacterales bacterium]
MLEHRICLLALSGCFGGVILISCGSPAATVSGAAASPPARPNPVAVVKAVTEPLRQEITLSGEFRPFQVVDVHAKVAGYLRNIKVDVGDRVKTGQVLATLEVPEMRDDVAHASAEKRRSSAELMRLRGELERAEANLGLVTLSHERLEKVMKAEPGLIAQQEIDEALARKRAADAQVAAAKAAIAGAEFEGEAAQARERRTRTLTEYTTITAPFTGMVTKRYADTGALIQAGTSPNAMPMVRIAQMNILRLVLPVAESVVSKVRLGQVVEIEVTSLHRRIRGTVARFTGDVEMATRTMNVEVDVPNAGETLLPGMYAEVKLTIEENNRAVTVPVQALASADGKKAVLVVSEEGVLEQRVIQTGMETAAKVEVTSGLAAGEMVVVGNKTQLRPGERVTPRESEI